MHDCIIICSRRIQVTSTNTRPEVNSLKIVYIHRVSQDLHEHTTAKS